MRRSDKTLEEYSQEELWRELMYARAKGLEVRARIAKWEESYYGPPLIHRDGHILLTGRGEMIVHDCARSGLSMTAACAHMGTSLHTMRNRWNGERFERAYAAGVEHTGELMAVYTPVMGHADILPYIRSVRRVDRRISNILHGYKTAHKRHAHPEQWEAGRWIPQEKARRRRRSKYDGHAHEMVIVRRTPPE